MFQDNQEARRVTMPTTPTAQKTPTHPGRRRALGELTNTPLLLSPQGAPHGHRLASPQHLMSQAEGVATPPKAVTTGSPGPDTITPTHNLKLLTELASKMSGSARQTLTFGDDDGGDHRYRHSEPMYLPSYTQAEAPSPHRDHPYGVKAASNAPAAPVTLPQVPTPVTKQFREEFVVVQPVTKARVKPAKQSGNNENFAPPPEKGANRKEKSLGLLAERMLAGLPENVKSGDTMELQLDDTAKALQTERRRIYDIVNVFEAVQIMSKVGKNVYQWHGRTFLVQSLAWLRQLAYNLNMDEQYRVARDQDIQMMIHNQENVNIENVSPLTTPGTPLTPTFSPMASPLASPLMSPYNSPNDPNGTSMGINTQKFLMLFLVTPAPQTLTLDFAAKVIHGIHQIEKTRLTRIRRLYDIANILQSLGLIRKVQVTDGRGKKPAFQFIGPDVSNMTLTEEEKKMMPATRQKNSLLAVGRNLVLLPEKETPGSGGKRGRSLSEERRGGEEGPAKLLRTRSESRVSDASETSSTASSLFDLSEICERERNKIKGAAEGEEERDEGEQKEVLMKPPTPGRPPSRKKHLLARYYSDSALLSSSSPRLVTQVTSPASGTGVSVTRLAAGQSDTSGQQSFTGPRPRPVARQYSPAQISCVPQSPRTNYSPLHPSPLTRQPSIGGSEKQYTPLRSPVTPRDLRNASILPPNSPQRSKLITCSPMGPVGRSLLSSPASPRAPIDLSVRTPHTARSGLGRSPLASRSLNLPPTPPEADSSLMKSNLNESTSPLLRAYLANNKNRIFKPINMSSLEEGVSVLPLDPQDPVGSVGLSPSTSISVLSLTSSPSSSVISSPPPTSSPDGSSASSSASELEGIFGGKPMPRPSVTVAKNPRPQEAVKEAGGGSPLDFSGLISAPAKSSPFSILSLTSPFLNSPRDLTTPHIELASSPSLQPPQVPAKRYVEGKVIRFKIVGGGKSRTYLEQIL